MHDSITLEQFKQAVADFTKEAPTADDEALECGFRAVGRMYFGIMPMTPLNLHQGKTYLEYASRRYFERRVVLDLGYNPMERLKAMVA